MCTDPRLHRRSDAAGRPAAQGRPPPFPCSCGQHRSELHRRCKGNRSGYPRAERQAHRRCPACSRPPLALPPFSNAVVKGSCHGGSRSTPQMKAEATESFGYNDRRDRLLRHHRHALRLPVRCHADHGHARLTTATYAGSGRLLVRQRELLHQPDGPYHQVFLRAGLKSNLNIQPAAQLAAGFSRLFQQKRVRQLAITTKLWMVFLLAKRAEMW